MLNQQFRAWIKVSGGRISWHPFQNAPSLSLSLARSLHFHLHLHHHTRKIGIHAEGEGAKARHITKPKPFVSWSRLQGEGL